MDYARGPLAPSPGAPFGAPRAPAPGERRQAAEPRRRAASATPAPEPPADSRRSGTYAKGDLVDFNSTSFRSWIPAQVVLIDPDSGDVTLDVKAVPITLQEQRTLLRRRQKPRQEHLEWMHAVLREGRIHKEARAVFDRYCVLDNNGTAGVLKDTLAQVAADIDGLLGCCGSVRLLLEELRPAERQALPLDGLVSAFWEHLMRVHHAYGARMPRQQDDFRRRENPVLAYDIERILGGGTYGQVKLVREKKTLARRAMKVISKRSMGGNRELLEAEIDNLCLVDHPNVAKLYECFEDASSIYLVMDFCSGGELLQRIDDAKRERRGLGEPFAIEVLWQLLLALVHIHARGIVHLDIKAANIMLMPSKKTIPPTSVASGDAPEGSSDKPHVMVIDLGVSQIFRPGNFKNNMPMGTPATMAPEIWSGEITPKADVFSSGAVFFEMFAFRLPFPQVPCTVHEAVRFWATRPIPQWGAMKGASGSASALCKSMMTIDRRTRPGAQGCMRNIAFGEKRLPAESSSSDGRDDAPDDQEVISLDLIIHVSQLAQRDMLYRSVAMNLARRWPANQWPSAKNWFTQVCSRGAGVIQVPRMAASLEHWGIDAGAATKAAEAMDFDGDGTIGWTDFIAACIDLGGEEFDDLLREAFDEADEDRDGLVSQLDLATLLPRAHAEGIARDIFQGLTGRTGPGARLDWTTFRKHFCCAKGAGLGAEVAVGGRRPDPGPDEAGGAAGFPDFFGIARDAADRMRCRYFPVPGDPAEEELLLQRCSAMGFTSREKCLDVIRRHQNKLSGSAVEELCNAGA